MAEETKATGGRRLDAEVLTFLIADVRGFTRFTQDQGDEAASHLASRFAETVRASVPAFGGELLEVRGDEALTVFGSARQALRASVELQRRFREPSSDEPFPLGVGIGLDAGEAVPTDGGYRGNALNIAARLCGLAAPGQILATDSVVHLAHRVDGLTYVPRRPVRLKGVGEPVRLVEIQPLEKLPPVPLPPTPPRKKRRLWVVAALLALVAAVVGALELAGVFAGDHQKPRPAISPVAGLYRIDLATNRVVQTIPLNRNQGVDQVRVGSGSVWVGGPLKGVPHLVLVDPQTGRARAFAGASAPFALGIGKVFVYGGVPGNRTNFATVFDIDNPTTVPNVIELQPFHSTQAPGPLEFGLGSLWAWEYGAEGCCDGTVFWRVDPQTHRVLGRWTNPRGASVGPWAPEGVAVGADGVWEVSEKELTRVYPSVLHVPAVQADAVAAGNGSVWAVSAATTLTEINPSTGTIAWTHHFKSTELDSIVVGQGSVWLADRFHRTITRVDIATRHIFAPVQLKSTPAAMAVGPTGLWVGFPRGPFPL